MAIAEKKWKILPVLRETSEALQQQLSIHPILCQLLVSRGIDSYEKAKHYFRPSLERLHDPFLMKDMEKAVSRVLQAIKKKERILIYGDYDVDGTSSVALMYDFLCSNYDRSQIDYYIPNRYKEGYGLSKKGIEYAVEHQIDLLITLDCGIKSVDLIQSASESGIETIVCDHHLPGAELPAAVAILNAKQPDCPYPFKELCACGVAFKFVQALVSRLALTDDRHLNYLQLVATATAADIVPIIGENRLLAQLGIISVNEEPSVGIKALIEESQIKMPLSLSGMSFMIGPRINAAGRMDDAKKAVALFIEKDPQKARALASQLQTDNTSRKEADAQITEEAIAHLEADMHLSERKSLVVYNEHWHKGVIGIVASRLVERYYRPTIVLTKSGDLLAGSARSIPGFNIHEGLEHCSELLVGFGGHYFAAGMTLLPEKLESFQKQFEEAAARSLSAEQLIPEITIDAEVQLPDLVSSFYRILEQMEPFGPENLRPIFCVRRVKNCETRIVKEEHVRFDIEQRGTRMNGIAFGQAKKFLALGNAQYYDLVFTLDENTFRDQTSLQLKVIDFRAAS